MNNSLKSGWRLFAGLLLALVCMIVTISPVMAADYLFTVPEEMVIFWIEDDGRVSISYDITFSNIGAPLDYIDIGTPNSTFNINEVEAEMDGVIVADSHITRADYSESGLQHGVTINRTMAPIPSGESANFYLYIPGVEQMFYDTDTTVVEGVDYVSFNFMPSYFSDDFVRGTTNMTVRLVYPSVLTQDDPRWFSPSHWGGEEEPDAWLTEDGHVVYEWNWADADASAQYTFGGALPKAKLTSDAGFQTDIATGGIGDTFFSIICCSAPFVILFVVIFTIVKNAKQNKESAGAGGPRSYLPPAINTSGNGIKRGLTAIEAAVLLETDLDKIITMIIYSLSKKDLIAIETEDPLKVEFADPLPEGLHAYETSMLAALKIEDEKKRKKAIVELVKQLVFSVKEKMEGFDSEETKEYYKSIIDKAWGEVEAADTAETKSKLLDQYFGWAMLDEDVEKKTTETFGDTMVYIPHWWWRTGSAYRHYRPVTVPSSSSVGGGSIDMPTLPGSEFARSITDSVRGFSDNVVGSLKSFTSSVANSTNPAPKSSSSRRSSSGRSGGYSCACACACAGCACACAGGGR